MVAELVSIEHKRPRAGLFEKIRQAPIAPPFFLTAIIAGFIGITYLGIHLWLMRTGQITISRDYSHLRTLHAFIQLYLFFGLFILGFILQASPKMLGVSSPAPRLMLLGIPCIIAGLILLAFGVTSTLSQLLISLPFAAAAALLMIRIRSASAVAKVGIGLFLLEGLITFAIGPWLSSANNWHMLLVFWGGVGAPILGASQQFTNGFLNGKKLSFAAALSTQFFFLGSIAIGVFLPGSPWFSLFVIAAIVSHAMGTKLWRAAALIGSEPLALAFILGKLWVIIGAVVLMRGIGMADNALHLWATGWALALVLSIVPRIVGFLSGKELIGNRALLMLIAGLQLIPLGRGFHFLVPPAFSWVLSVVAGVIYCFWTYLVFVGIYRIVRRQMSLSKGEDMVHC